jgi:hypothetical protein
MRPALLLGGLFLSACTIGAIDPGDDAPDPASGEVAGSITRDQTWSDAVTMIGDVTIEAGATVTVAAGTELTAREGVSLRVRGTLVVAGTAAEPVTLLPTADAVSWAGVIADPGGSVQLSHAEGTDVAVLLYCHAGAILCHLDGVHFTKLGQAIVAEDVALLTGSRIVDIANGGVTVRGPAGDLTVRDSYVLTSRGDLIVQTGGTLLVEYSEIGDTLGSYDHCNFHVSSASSLTITRTNIINGVVGMMLGGTTGASITYNNWSGNDTDLSEVGINSAVDLRNNYWASGAPALGGAYDVSGAAGAPIADAGPRP